MSEGLAAPVGRCSLCGRLVEQGDETFVDGSGDLAHSTCADPTRAALERVREEEAGDWVYAEP